LEVPTTTGLSRFYFVKYASRKGALSMFYWSVENNVWEVDTTFWPKPLEVTEEEDGRTRKIHPKPRDKFSLEFSKNKRGGGVVREWSVNDGVGEVKLSDRSKWRVTKIGSTKWKVVAKLS